MERERPLVRAALLAIGAGLVHGMATPSHFDEWWGYGAFFLIAMMAQVVYGAAILFPRILHEAPITALWPARMRRLYYGVGIAGNVAIVLLYLVTRTIGIPLVGPEAGVVERVGALDLVSKLIEVALVVQLALLLRAARATPAPAAILDVSARNP